MFTREAASRIRHEFWTTYGKYMSPVPLAEGLKINWINYHTGIKDIYFRMETLQKSAAICISIEHEDKEIRQLHYEQFLELKNILHATLEETWEWQPEVLSDGRASSRIEKSLQDVSVFNKEHWPELISFFKPRIIALDAFWENAKYSFEALK